MYLNNKILTIFIILITLISSCNNTTKEEALIVDSIDSTLLPLSKISSYYNMNELSGWKLIRTAFINDNATFPMNSKFLSSKIVWVKFQDGDSSQWYSNSGGYYYYEKTGNDTICRISLEYYCSDKDTLSIARDYFVRYEIPEEGHQHIILLGKNSDTLYHYKAWLFGDMNKQFIRGKYYYELGYGKLTRGQRYFMELHKDSMIAVRGDILPEIPEITPVPDSVHLWSL